MTPSTELATIRRDSGMALAVAKADRDRPGWSGDALNALRYFAAVHPGEQFLAEKARFWCEATQIIDAPENEKAWGSVMRLAAKEGLVFKVGYAPAASSNRSPKTLWQATVTTKAAA